MARIESNAAESIGARITAARIEAGAMRRELAACAGIETTTLGRYETGKALPNLATLVRLAYTLGVEPGDLIADVTWSQFPKQRDAPVPIGDFLAGRRGRS